MVTAEMSRLAVRPIFRLGAALAVGMLLMVLMGSGSNVVHASLHLPTANCVTIDGVFTDCDGDGDPLEAVDEWGDVGGTGFPAGGPFTSILRANQADLDPPPGGELTHVILHYDEIGRQTPLANDEFALVFLNTVNDGALQNVSVRIFNDGTVTVIVDGVVLEDPAGTTRAAEIQHYSGCGRLRYQPRFLSPPFDVRASCPQGGCGPEPSAGDALYPCPGALGQLRPSRT